MNNQTIELLKKRDLEKSYFSINFITTKIYMEEGINYVNPRTAYVLFGITLEGRRKYITTIIDKECPKTSDWYNVFQELKKRKIEHVIYAIIPDNKQIRDAITLAFPKIETFISCEKTIFNLLRYESYKNKDEVYREVRRLYVAKDKVEYEVNRNDFIEKYKNYPLIMELLKEEIERLEKNYKYSYKVRRIIYSFNYVIELKKRLSKIANKKYFDTKEEFVEYLVSYITRSERAVHYKKEEWLEMLNEIYEEKKEMIKPYL